MALKLSEQGIAWLAESSLVLHVELSHASTVFPDSSYGDVVQRRRMLEDMILQPAVVLDYRVDEYEIRYSRFEIVVEKRKLQLYFRSFRLAARFGIPPWSVVDAHVSEKSVYHLADNGDVLRETRKKPHTA